MLGELKAELSLANFNERIATWSKVAGVSLAEGMKIQAGLLKQDLMKGAPPLSLAKSKRQASKDARKIFAPKPLDTFDGTKAQGKGMVWLYAGKKGGRFLVGVNPSDNQPGISESQMDKLRSNKLRDDTFRGAAWRTIGTRGKGANAFRVLQVNRTMTGRGRLIKFVDKLQKQFGLLKASWVVGMEQFGRASSVPGWVAAHLASGKAKGKNIINLQGQRPSVQIISNAKGVESERALQNVRRTVKKRSGSMVADMRMYLAGTKKKAGFKIT